MPLCRTDKLNKEFQHLIAEFVARELDCPPNFLITVTGVQIDAGLAEARVWVSILPFENAKSVIDILIKNKQNLVSYLNKNIKIRRIPRLIFLIDETEERASEVEETIKEIND